MSGSSRSAARMTKVLAGSLDFCTPSAVVEFETCRDPLGAQALPEESRVALPAGERGAPGRPAGLDVFHLGDVDALGGKHRIGDRLPGGGTEQHRLAFEALQVGHALALAEGDGKVSRAPMWNMRFSFMPF